MKVGDGNREGPGRKVQQKAYRRWPARAQVRVKWWGKSPPRRGQPERHCKPRVVQDRTGEGLPARPSPGISRTPRKRGAPLRRSERNDRTVPRERDGQNPAYRGAAIFFSECFAESGAEQLDAGYGFAHEVFTLFGRVSSHQAIPVSNPWCCATPRCNLGFGRLRKRSRREF